MPRIRARAVLLVVTALHHFAFPVSMGERPEAGARVGVDAAQTTPHWSLFSRPVRMQDPNYLLFGFDGESPGIRYKNQLKLMVSASFSLADYCYERGTLRDGDFTSSYRKSLSLDIGYQHLTFWNIYDGGVSRPIYDNNYSPSIALTWRTLVPGTRLALLLAAGYAHQSNGEPTGWSRSWERAFGRVGIGDLEHDVLSGRLDVWYPYGLEENPDLHQYNGIGKLTLYYQPLLRKGMPLSDIGFSLGYRIAARNAANIELGAFVNPFAFVGRAIGGKAATITHEYLPTLYLQYYYGKGENMLDYRACHSSIRVGIAAVY
jgi:hypothetical protein